MVNPCTVALSDPSSATDQQLWDCAQAPTQLGTCVVDLCTSGCACAAYVRSSMICTSGFCSAPLNGTGCSDGSFYQDTPFFCAGDQQSQSASMLRYLIANNYCGP